MVASRRRGWCSPVLRSDGTTEGLIDVNSHGTVFKLNTDNSGFAVLKEFTGGSDGAWVRAGFVLSGNTLYGRTTEGGDFGGGTVFRLNTDGTGFATLRSLSGTAPGASLTLSGSTLYGTAGGGSFGYRTVFQMNTDGAGFYVLKSFTPTDGEPQRSLILSGNTLYGTTSGGRREEPCSHSRWRYRPPRRSRSSGKPSVSQASAMV